MIEILDHDNPNEEERLLIEIHDNENQEDREAQLRKVRKIVDHVTEKLVEYYTPDQHISIDEGTLRLDFK